MQSAVHLNYTKSARSGWSIALRWCTTDLAGTDELSSVQDLEGKNDLAGVGVGVQRTDARGDRDVEQ